MKKFTDWLFEQVDMSVIGTEKVIDKISNNYDKAKLAIDLVRKYDDTLPPQSKLLLDISTVAPLSKNVYGLYNSTENTNILGPEVEQKMALRFGKQVWDKYKQKLEHLPLAVLKKELKIYPEIDLNKIKTSSVINVNINRNRQAWTGKPNADALAVLEIASTIVHEATHAMDVKNGVNPTEDRAVAAEKKFKEWVYANIKTLVNDPVFKALGFESIAAGP